MRSGATDRLCEDRDVRSEPDWQFTTGSRAKAEPRTRRMAQNRGAPRFRAWQRLAKPSSPAISLAMPKKFAVALAIVLVSVGSALAQSDYVQAVEKWRSDRETNLKKESGWLSLAGLFWLKEGVNTVGTGPQFDVRLTDNFKGGRFGEIDFKNGVAKLQVASGVEATCDGKPVSTIDLVSDEEGKPTEIRVGSQMFYLIRREDRFGIRLKDSQSKARQEFKGLELVSGRRELPRAGPARGLPRAKGGDGSECARRPLQNESPGVLRFTLQDRNTHCTPS
jgi:hypothetical protein